MAQDHVARCNAFWLWALPGALLSFAFVTGFSIGLFVLPFAVFAFVVVGRSERAHAARGAAWGVLGGIGATLIGIAVLNAAAGWFKYWLPAGGALLAVAMAAFAVVRRV